MTSDWNELEREVAELSEALREAATREREYGQLLDELESRQTETVGRLALARQQVTDFEARLTARQADLEAARTEAAQATFERTIAGRDAATLAAAADINALLVKLNDLETWAEQLAEIKSSLGREGVSVEIAAEPDEFVDAWRTLSQFVRSKLEEKLEDELLEAAIRSANATAAIARLPEHLQELARQRRREIRLHRGRRELPA